MELFPLPIFPEGSLSESVVTTVWVGVFVVAFFNLRFGWVLSGLVVPGYLVPLLLLRPVGVGVIIAEAILTYAVVRALCNWGAKQRHFSALFGRDRFFALVVISILVRGVLDGFVLPPLGRYGRENGLWNVEFESSLHSFGLIVVSLIANQLWKPGLVRGLGSLVTTTGVTFVIVRYGLMNATNLTMGNLLYMYEDMSASILSSPKAYIILLVSAQIASRLNLYYSWDFNGILLPSLLALQWYDPLRIGTSFLEAWFVYACACGLLRLPMFQGKTIEGAWKLLLFFNLSFLYKMGLGHGLALFGSTISVVDCYGFGYLLPTLLAVKMYEKRSASRITRTALQASFVGVAAGSTLGFFLTLLPSLASWEPPRVAQATLQTTSTSLPEQVRRDKAGMYRMRFPDRVAPASARSIERFQEGLEELRTAISTNDMQKRQYAFDLLASVEHEVRILNDGRISLVDRSGLTWGLTILDPRYPEGIVVQIPAALREPGTLEAGLHLAEQLQAGVVAVSTRGPFQTGSRRLDSLTSYRTHFHAVHRVFRDRGVLQVRGYTTASVEELFDTRLNPGALTDDPFGPGLWINDRIPRGLSLGRLRELVGELHQMEWGGQRRDNLQRKSSRRGFAELHLDLRSRRGLTGRFYAGLGTIEVAPQLRPISGYLQEWILENKDQIAQRGSNKYETPSVEELLLLDHEVVQPLSEIARRYENIDEDLLTNSDLENHVRSISAVAAAFGYRVTLYIHAQSNQQYLILSELEQTEQSRRYWGLYVFRIGSARPFVIEIPRPLFERNTFEYGIGLFEELQATALLIAGAHPRANTDGSADVIRPINKVSLFQLVHEKIATTIPDADALFIQTRAYGQRPNAATAKSDVLVAFGDGSTDITDLPERGQDLIAQIESDALTWEFVRGTPLTVGYEPYGTLQAQHLTRLDQRHFVAIWLSSLARFGYRRQPELASEELLFDAVAIATEELPLDELLLSMPVASKTRLPDSLIGTIQHFQRTQDITALETIRRQTPGLELRRVIHAETQKSFLIFVQEGSLLPVVATVGFRPQEGKPIQLHRPIDPYQVRAFASSNASWLEIEDPQ